MMKLMPQYAETVIIGVIFHNTWNWFVTEREYWFLNMEMEDRFGIEILNETTAAFFLEKIADYRVSASELIEMLAEFKDSFQYRDEILEFIPSFYVNFDEKTFYSLYPEMIAFESYVPDGWIGEYKDFLPIVPEGERYWMINGHDFFEEMYKKLPR